MEDFELFAQKTDDAEQRVRRQHWIESLRQDRQPLTSEMIDMLLLQQ